MPYPSTLTSFNNPGPLDRLNSPSHSSVETAQNTGLTELQTYIGVITGASASAVGTLLYDIKAPDSNGGGHVQTAIKGGTGQTTYTKGDVLVGQSSSTLTKVAVGTDGQILSANSSVATGISWINDSRPKVHTSASAIGVSGTETSLLSITLPGSTLGTSNAVITTAYIGAWTSRSGHSVLATVHYGGNAIASVKVVQGAASAADSAGFAKIIHTMIASTATVQRHFLEFDGRTTVSDSNSMTYFTGSITGAAPRVLDTNTSSVNSGADQALGMTAIIQGGLVSMTRTGIIVEKIT